MELRKIPKKSDLRAFLDTDGDGAVTEAERRNVVSLWQALISEVKSKVPEILRQKLDLGVEAVIEDQHELSDLPKKLQKAVRQWEKLALQLDTSLASGISDGSEL